MRKRDVDYDNIFLYTTLTFNIDEGITATFKNLFTEDLEKFTDRFNVLEMLIKEVQWYMFGTYDDLYIESLDMCFTIISKTKTKVELIVKR